MLKSREEITKQCGELIDTIGEIFDDKIKYERKFCEEARKRKESETELAEANFRIEKALTLLKNNIGNNAIELRVETIKILEGKNE